MRARSIVLLLSLSACAAEAPPAPPTIIVLDSVRLLETDAAPFGSYVMGIARSPSAELFLSEFRNHAISVYGPDGTFRRSLGREGSGPGEFRTPSGIALLDSGSVLAGADPTRGVIVLFDAGSGELRGEVPYPGGAVAWGNWSEGTTEVMIPVVGVASPFLRWGRPDDRIEAFGEMPPEWAGSPGLSMSHGFPAVVPDTAGWLALVQLVPGVIRLDTAGTRRGLLELPAVRRRGAPAGAAQAAIDAARRDGKRDDQPVASMTLGMHRRSDGLLMVLHLDPVIARTESGLVATGQHYFLSLLDPRRGEACVDAEVPIAPDELALQTFAGDTVFFLEQRTTEAGAVERWLRAFLVDAAGCDWMPATADRAGPA